MRTLYPYQERAVHRLVENNVGGAAMMPPGLGKTITAIRAAQFLRSRRVLVVGPVSAIGVWEDELAQEGEPFLAPTGTRKEKAEEAVLAGDGWIILNYEALLSKDVEKALLKWDPTLVIFDESHKIKTPTAKRSRAAHRLSRDRRTFLLTGTPITKNHLDLYSQYKAIDPWIWDGMTWTKFKQHYAIFGGFEGREVVGIRDTEDIKGRIRPYTFSARKEDVLDLPPRRDQRVPVAIGGLWAAYRDLAEEGVYESIVTMNPLTLALRLQQMVHEAKKSATIDRAEEILGAGEKVVIFYRFLSEGKELEEGLARYPVFHVHGSVTDRTKQVQGFQNLEGPGVFLGQIQATSTAITLTAAHEVIFHSLSWAYEDFVQARDRVHRIGQSDPVRYQYMTVVGPNGGKLIDDRILESMHNKRSFSEDVLGDPRLLLPT